MDKQQVCNISMMFILVAVSVYIFVVYAERDPIATAMHTAVHRETASLRKLSELRKKWIEVNAQGEECVRDAGAYLIPVRAYKKIVCLSSAVDAFLVRIIDVQRIAGYSTYSKGKVYAAVVSHLPDFRSAKDLEAILNVHPDLVIAPSSVADVSQLKRLREAGLTVFNTGDSRGYQSFIDFSGQVAVLIDAEQAGSEQLQAYRQRIQSILPDDFSSIVKEKKSALYVSMFSGNFYGGVKGSSYHDVIRFAGLHDITDEHTWRTAWPQLSIEQLLQMNPDYIITPSGRSAAIRAHPGLQDMTALIRGQVMEVDYEILNDPGFFMYDAAQYIYDYVYGGKGTRDSE